MKLVRQKHENILERKSKHISWKEFITLDKCPLEVKGIFWRAPISATCIKHQINGLSK